MSGISLPFEQLSGSQDGHYSMELGSCGLACFQALYQSLHDRTEEKPIPRRDCNPRPLESKVLQAT